MAESTLVRFLPAIGKLRLDAVFCLVAILANLILPLAHQCHCHLHALEELNATTPMAAGQEISRKIEAGESDEEAPFASPSRLLPSLPGGFTGRLVYHPNHFPVFGFIRSGPAILP